MQAALLIYDAECPLCRRAVAWVTARALPGAVEPLSCQDPDRPRRAPSISETACMEAMHLVTPDGAVHAGSDAAPHLLARLRGYRWVAPLFKIPGVAWIARPVYRRIARNRQAISALFLRKTAERCDIDGDCR